MDDVINVSGHRIGTAEVESALVAHPQCAEAAVVGYEHPVKGQGIWAYVTLLEVRPRAAALPPLLLLSTLLLLAWLAAALAASPGRRSLRCRHGFAALVSHQPHCWLPRNSPN